MQLNQFLRNKQARFRDAPLSLEFCFDLDSSDDPDQRPEWILFQIVFHKFWHELFHIIPNILAVLVNKVDPLPVHVLDVAIVKENKVSTMKQIK